jgi:hypothetical protein
MSDPERLSRMVAEMRAAELVRALRAAVDGSAHWRPTAQQLLRLIDAGVPPEHPALHREAAE